MYYIFKETKLTANRKNIYIYIYFKDFVATFHNKIIVYFLRLRKNIIRRIS